MDKPTKLLIIGVVLGGLIMGVGQIRTWQLEKRIKELQAECARESKQTIKEPKIKLVCDSKDLLRLETDTPAPGIQGKLVSAQRNLNRWKETSILIGLAVFLILSVPWCWYFLLRRVKELSQAIIGK